MPRRAAQEGQRLGNHWRKKEGYGSLRAEGEDYEEAQQRLRELQEVRSRSEAWGAGGAGPARGGHGRGLGGMGAWLAAPGAGALAVSSAATAVVSLL